MMLRLRSAQASLRHIRAVTRKEIHHIVRDRSTLLLVLFTPTLVLLLMGYALTVDLKHIPIAVLDLDRTQTSQAFIQQITAGQDLDLYRYAASMEEIDAMLMRGKIKAAVIIAPGFASDLQAMKRIPLQLIIDGTEPESGQYAVEHISQRVEEFINIALTVQLRAQGISITSLQILDLRIQTWYNPDLKPRNALIPGLISMVLGFPALSVALTLAH
ncbi:MAG: ABC transporter permease, partial [Lentisphaeria bacterium]|nr:ABC transporter permease [Lentisphaeria bacterium]